MTTATVNISVYNNATFDFPFQFGVAGDTSWSFAHCDFYSDVKPAANESPLLSMSTVTSPESIVVLDEVNRILKFNVQDVIIRNQLPSANSPYVYDLIMVNQTTGQIDVLMTGSFVVQEGVTKLSGSP